MKSTVAAGLAVMSLLSGCGSIPASAPVVDAERNETPPWPVIARYAEEFGIERLVPELTEVQPLAFEVLPGRATKISYGGTVPPYELILVQHGPNLWEPTLFDNSVVGGWELAIRSLLVLAPSVQDSVADAPMAASRDLTKVLVDPDPEVGKVLTGRQDIPLDHVLSDVLHDLQADRVSPSVIKRRFLAPLKQRIAPPQTTRSNEGLLLTFYTWNLYGGEVARWEATLCSVPSIHGKVVASRVGAYRRSVY